VLGMPVPGTERSSGGRIRSTRRSGSVFRWDVGRRWTESAARTIRWNRT
jgi:hypothetical protein